MGGKLPGNMVHYEKAKFMNIRKRRNPGQDMENIFNQVIKGNFPT